MSEVKLNLIDAHVIVAGAIHGSIADRFIAALSAEPETIPELCDALTRYEKPRDGFRLFASFRPTHEVDATPWDAGFVLIDLAARIIASDSTYSQPGPEGVVHYHDGTQATDVPIHYRLPADWLFVNSVEAYFWSRDRRRKERKKHPPLDARAVLYGRPLLEFIVKSLNECPPLPLEAVPLSLGEGHGGGSLSPWERVRERVLARAHLPPLFLCKSAMGQARKRTPQQTPSDRFTRTGC